MGNVGSSNRVTAHDRAIFDMKIQRDKLRQYQKKIQAVLDREHEIAKDCLRRNDKNRALLALRKRKYQEQMMKKTDSQLEALEQLTSTIEFSLIQKDVMFGLQQGTAVLKELQKEMSLEAVEKLVGETQDAIAYQKEVNELLASTMSNEDEEAVEEEFKAMEREAAGRVPGIKLPNVPNGPLKSIPDTGQPVPAEAEAEEERERMLVPA